MLENDQDAMMDSSEAAAALAAVNEARDKLVDIGTCPPWRHAATGALFAMLVSANLFDHALRAPLLIGSMVGMVLIVAWDRKHYGVFVNGYRRGRTLWSALTMLAALLVLVVAGMSLREDGASLLARLGVVGATFGTAIGFSLAWHASFRREMAERV